MTLGLLPMRLRSDGLWTSSVAACLPRLAGEGDGVSICRPRFAGDGDGARFSACFPRFAGDGEGVVEGDAAGESSIG